jgi:hypothetical protein
MRGARLSENAHPIAILLRSGGERTESAETESLGPLVLDICDS